MIPLVLALLLVQRAAAASDFHLYAASDDPASAASLAALLDGGHDPNDRSPDGESGLHLACIWGSAAKVKALLAAGADPNFRASSNPASLDMTALTWCCYAGYRDAVAAFLEDPRIDVNLVVRQEDGGRLTALDIARKIEERGSETALLLALHGAKTFAELLAEHDGVEAAVPGMPPPPPRRKREL